MQKYFVVLFVLFIGLYFAGFFPQKSSKGFSASDIFKENRGMSERPTEEIQKSFSYNLHYLGHGRQSIAFETLDSKYVLKFFLKNQVYNCKASMKGMEKRIPQLHNRNIDQACRMYEKVYQEIPEMAALCSIHLDVNTTDWPQVSLVGKKGELITIDLNKYCFVVQKKCESLAQYYKKIQDPELKKKMVDDILVFFQNRFSFGYCDKRNHLFLRRNFGVVDGHVVQLDIGDLYYSESVKSQSVEYLPKIERKLQRFLVKTQNH